LVKTLVKSDQISGCLAVFYGSNPTLAFEPNGCGIDGCVSTIDRHAPAILAASWRRWASDRHPTGCPGHVTRVISRRTVLSTSATPTTLIRESISFLSGRTSEQLLMAIVAVVVTALLETIKRF
jgi:hypothetical protein